MLSSVIRSPIFSSGFKPNQSLKLKANDIRKLFKNSFKSIGKNPEVRAKNVINLSSQNTPKLVLKYGLFASSVFGICFTCSPIILYERMLKQQKRQRVQLVQKYTDLRLEINRYWNGINPIQKTYFGILLVNVLVCLSWRSQRFNGLMSRYFLLHPESGKLSQMVLSVFSHHSYLHLAANMLALYSISGSLASVRCISNSEQFLAYYISAGVFASFVSNACKLLLTGVRNPSLGASGAVIACFSLLAINYPKSQFYVFPIPMPLEAQQVLGGLVIFDTLGTILRWTTMDHACHLGGAFFGAAFNYFQKSILSYQLKVYKKYKSIRGN